MPFPSDPTSFLQPLGFSAKSDSGYQIKYSRNDNCVFIFGWSVDTYRLWYSLFLIECLDIELYYVSVCKRSAVFGTPDHQSGGEGEEGGEGGAAGGDNAGGSGSGSGSGSADDWIVTYTRRATETTCSLGSAEDVTHTNLQNLFNTKMGVSLPNPPSGN